MDRKIIILVITLIVKMVSAGHYIDGYYFSYPMAMSWYEAQRFCAYQGMYLLDIPNDKEYDKLDVALEKLKMSTNSSMMFNWIAGTRLGSDNGQFYWVTTGHPMWYQKWGEAEPNNIPQQQCVVLNPDRLFADADCGIKSNFICRIKYQDPVMRDRSKCNLF